jgi:hypothetical protein
MPPALLNGLMFNVSWFGIVFFHSSLLAPLVAAIHVALHLRLMGRVGEPALIAVVLVVGLALDQVLFALGVFTLSGQSALAPLWLGCLWPVLATTLSHAFAFLHSRLLLAAIFGAVGGCASYLAGTRLSPVAFASADSGPVVIALLWSVLLPLLLLLAARLVRTKGSAGVAV